MRLRRLRPGAVTAGPPPDPAIGLYLRRQAVGLGEGGKAGGGGRHLTSKTVGTAGILSKSGSGGVVRSMTFAVLPQVGQRSVSMWAIHVASDTPFGWQSLHALVHARQESQIGSHVGFALLMVPYRAAASVREWPPRRIRWPWPASWPWWRRGGTFPPPTRNRSGG